MRHLTKLGLLGTCQPQRLATTATRIGIIPTRALSSSILPRRNPQLTAPRTARISTQLSTSTFSTSTAKMEAISALAEEDRVAYSSMEGRLQPQFLKALADMGYEYMSPVQQKVLDGNLLPDLGADVIVRAKTGTGKTTAFLLPVLQTLMSAKQPRGQVGVLIMSPTRELATQIAKECDQLTKYCSPRIECHLAYGGSNKSSHLNKFMNGNPSILVATPGRLNDYLQDDLVRAKFSHIRAVVLDEADTMLETGFLEAMKEILAALPPKAKNGWQGLLYSATMPDKMKQVIHHVVNPKCITISTIDENEAPTVDKIPQSFIPVASVHDVLPTLHTVLSDNLTKSAETGEPLKAIVFGTTANTTRIMYQVLEGSLPKNLPTWQIHSRLSQPQRTKTTEQFKKAKSGVLFASDVVGRGMDFPNVTLVAQVGLPQTSDQYVHRVGRTGRAGKGGEATMILTPDEMFFRTKNPQYPMTQQEVDADQVNESRQLVNQALESVSEDDKRKAYVGVLGHTKSFAKPMGLGVQGIVKFANEYSRSIGCEEPPELEAKTIGKLGMKGTPGLRVMKRAAAPGGRSEEPPQKKPFNRNRLPAF